MTEPGAKPDGNPRNDVGTLRAGKVLDTESGHTSPLRFLLVIAPLLVILIAGANVLGLWTTELQQAARPPQVERRPFVEEIFNRTAPKMPSVAAEKAPAGNDSEFDVAIVLALLPKAKPEDGASVFKMCRACHDSEKNAPARIGTSLWGIVNQRKATRPGFNYSAALRAKGGTWSYRDLADYLNNPRKFAPGTSMAFAGIVSNRRMADLLAYLRTLSDNPAPLPN
jgi:cytochrome c